MAAPHIHLLYILRSRRVLSMIMYSCSTRKAGTVKFEYQVFALKNVKHVGLNFRKDYSIGDLWAIRISNDLFWSSTC